MDKNTFAIDGKSRAASLARQKRWKAINILVRLELPEFIKAVANPNAQSLLIHQDAFAGDLQMGELLLLGAAIKYAGVHGKDIQIIGKAGSTFGGEVEQ